MKTACISSETFQASQSQCPESEVINRIESVRCVSCLEWTRAGRTGATVARRAGPTGRYAYSMPLGLTRRAMWPAPLWARHVGLTRSRYIWPGRDCLYLPRELGAPGQPHRVGPLATLVTRAPHTCSTFHGPRPPTLCAFLWPVSGLRSSHWLAVPATEHRDEERPAGWTVWGFMIWRSRLNSSLT